MSSPPPPSPLLHPSPFISELALYSQTGCCSKDLLRNLSSCPANRTEAHAADLLNPLRASQGSPKYQNCMYGNTYFKSFTHANGLCWFVICLWQSDMKVVAGLQKWWRLGMSQLSPCDAAGGLVKLVIYMLRSGGAFICRTLGLSFVFGTRTWQDMVLQMFQPA